MQSAAAGRNAVVWRRLLTEDDALGTQVHSGRGDEDRLPHHDWRQQLWLRLVTRARASGHGGCR